MNSHMRNFVVATTKKLEPKCTNHYLTSKINKIIREGSSVVATKEDERITQKESRS
jgi:hypothetical protein